MRKNLTTEKLQKVLARAGIGSRRQMEKWISEGKVQVNNRTASLGIRVSARDQIKVNGKVLKKHLSAGRKSALEVILYHKPVGEISSRRDPAQRKTVFDNLPKPLSGRWVSVGRLDINTSGLMLFTNDGSLANQLMHPSSQVDREYAVRTYGTASEAKLDLLRNGIQIDNITYKFDDVVDSGGEGRNHWYHVVLREGKNREVRNMFAAIDLPVSRLQRVRYGPFLLANLSPGKTRALGKKDIKYLKDYLKKCKLSAVEAAEDSKSL